MTFLSVPPILTFNEKTCCAGLLQWTITLSGGSVSDTAESRKWGQACQQRAGPGPVSRSWPQAPATMHPQRQVTAENDWVPVIHVSDCWASHSPSCCAHLEVTNGWKFLSISYLRKKKSAINGVILVVTTHVRGASSTASKPCSLRWDGRLGCSARDWATCIKRAHSGSFLHPSGLSPLIPTP